MVNKNISFDREEFIRNYVITFLASYAAREYDDCCMRGQHQRLENPPCEDAFYLAEKAWERMEQLGLLK